MATLTMTWTPTTPTTIGYEVRYGLNSPTPSYLYLTTTDTDIIISGLLNGETYQVGVRALCEGNIYSEWTSNQIVICDDTGESTMDGYAIYDSTIVFGTLYNWYAATDSRIAESGWHVTTNNEWNNMGIQGGATYTTLTDPSREIIENFAHKLKTTTIWKSSIIDNIDFLGLNVTPNGIVTNDGLSIERLSTGIFWCSDEQNANLGKYKKFEYDNNNIYRNVNYYNKHYGFSIRLIKDNPSGWSEDDRYVDNDGNVYPTKLMPDGNVWLSEDLRVSTYTDGSPIDVNPADWSTRTTGAIHTY